MALFTIRSERRLCEELEFAVLYRCFLDLHADEPMWDSSTFACAHIGGDCRDRELTPHVARRKRGTSLDDATAATAD